MYFAAATYTAGDGHVRGEGGDLPNRILDCTTDAMNTASTLPIENLSIADKLLLMERLWADLSRRTEDIPSPDWHGDVLEAREAEIREGRTAFIEWDDAKQRLRERYK